MLYPLTDSSHMGLLVHPWCTYSFMPQLPKQLSSAIQPGPATLVNCIQCPLRDKIILRPSEIGKMNASMLVYCVGVATRPALCPIAKETASAAPTLCKEYGPNLLLLQVIVDGLRVYPSDCGWFEGIPK